jgi:hypothetical protein
MNEFGTGRQVVKRKGVRGLEDRPSSHVSFEAISSANRVAPAKSSFYHGSGMTAPTGQAGWAYGITASTVMFRD